MFFDIINKFILELPNLFIYFFPGFIFLKFRNYKLSKNIDNKMVLYIESIILSYLLVEVFNKLMPQKWLSLFLYIFVLLISVLYCHFDVEEKLFEFLKINKNNFFQNKEKWVYVYIEEEQIIYFGKLNYINNNEKIIVVGEYKIYNYNFEKLSSINECKNVLINLNDVSKIEYVNLENCIKVN